LQVGSSRGEVFVVVESIVDQAIEQRILEARPIALDRHFLRHARLPDVSVVRIDRRRRPMVIRPYGATLENKKRDASRGHTARSDPTHYHSTR
jgi:hypothetical protein